ncbi:MAG: SDR family NAD(P)-dependent oxidoreductase [Verrucomicrobiota bacterium]
MSASTPSIERNAVLEPSSGQAAIPLDRLAGKVALVTGAASGIGRATAIVLARHDVKVVCADIAADGAQATAAAISRDGGDASAFRLDVTAESDWRAALEQVFAAHNQLDILVNCAGVSFAAPVADMRLEDWRRVMAVNLDGVFLGTKHAILALRRHASGGSIINVASASGLKASAGASAYSTSKAAVCMFTKAVAKECLERGDHIRLNTVCPGGVKTPLWRTMPFFQELMAKHGSEEAAFRALEQSAPQGRFAEPEEIALAVLFLASDASGFVTGTDLIIDGGYTL